MPPKTRGSKNSKENIGAISKTKTKATKIPRKALADKTNSASDDNASLHTKHRNIVCIEQDNLSSKSRPRRDCRVPTRYVESNGLNKVSNRSNGTVEIQEPSREAHIKNNLKVVLSPLKTPKICLDSSLATRRPKRICRLPSKFDDHSVSPSKFVSVLPAYASTPKILSKTAQQIRKNSLKNVSPKNKVIATKTNKKRIFTKKSNDTMNTHSPNSSADTNNNAKKHQLPPDRTKNIKSVSSKLHYTKTTGTKKHVDKNFSYRILEDKKKSLKRDASTLDVYEFTYDPNEEPPPQKKKRKKPIKKREPKPKTFVFNNNYDKNLAKALTALKNTVSTKVSKPVIDVAKAKVLPTHGCTTHPSVNTVVTTVSTQPVPTKTTSSNTDKNIVSTKNFDSVRVEDIALDFEEDNCIDEINYSPVHSPFLSSTSVLQKDIVNTETSGSNNNPLNVSSLQKNTLLPNRLTANNDPLNLRDDLSFFDGNPVASSSMNVSVRNPEASPWRVEFGSLPIKWQVNTYVKPNMTPAFESSFINFNDSKKKHVYTNLVPDTNEENDLPQIYDDNTSKLKQTSIISFIKEVVEKSAKKKKDKMTPIKANSLFKDLNNASVYKGATFVQKEYVTPKKNAKKTDFRNDEVTTPAQFGNDSSIENRGDTNNSDEMEKSTGSSKSSSRKKKRDKDVTYFGFDETENQDQENVSPCKTLDKRRLRALKPRSRAVLQEINGQKAPTRALLPIAVKSKPLQSSEIANKMFDNMKPANEPPVFPDKETCLSTEPTNVSVVHHTEDSNDDHSVHLFEDIQVSHHTKTHRKSYGKAKKAVAFRRNSISDSDVPHSDTAERSNSSEEDDLHDLTFKIPAFESKKISRKRKKPKLSKKEQQEVEAWAAGFNSMCEDIEDFNLVVE